MSTRSLAGLGEGIQSNIQLDWTNREFVQNISDQIENLALFMSKFDVSTRQILAKLDSKCTRIERVIETLEHKARKSAPELKS